MPEITLFFNQVVQFFHTFFPGIHINLLDLIIVVIIIYYAIEGYALGFILALCDLLSFAFSFFLALKYYIFAAKALVSYFSLQLGLAHGVGFFCVAFLSEIIINIVFRYLLRFLPSIQTHKRIYNFLKSIDHFLGIIPGMISAFIVLSFLLTVIVSLPASPIVKRLVTGSEIGSMLIANTSMFESRLNDVFGGALDEPLGLHRHRFDDSHGVGPRRAHASHAPTPAEGNSRVVCTPPPGVVQSIRQPDGRPATRNGAPARGSAVATVTTPRQSPPAPVTCRR